MSVFYLNQRFKDLRSSRFLSNIKRQSLTSKIVLILRTGFWPDETGIIDIAKGLGQTGDLVAHLIYSEVLYLWDLGCRWRRNNSRLVAQGLIQSLFCGGSVSRWGCRSPGQACVSPPNGFRRVVIIRQLDQSVSGLRIGTSSRGFQKKVWDLKNRNRCYSQREQWMPLSSQYIWWTGTDVGRFSFLFL